MAITYVWIVVQCNQVSKIKTVKLIANKAVLKVVTCQPKIYLKCAILNVIKERLYLKINV